MGRSPEYIHSLLRAIVDRHASLSQLNELVRLVHEMAVVRLQRHLACGGEHLLTDGLSVSSIAMDCTAELFARNDRNEFVVLAGYFKDIAKLSPAETVIALRALVFESLHDGVVRLYQEVDPVYAKILRTIRRVLPTLPDVRLIERFGETVVVAPEDEQLELPPVTRDVLQKWLAPAVIGSLELKTALAALPRILAGQDVYARSCTVSDLAAAVKQIYVKHVADSASSNVDLSAINVDVHQLLGEAYGELEDWLMRKYVVTGKLNEGLCRAYLAACRDFLTATFIVGNGERQQYWDYLKPHLDGVSYEAYRAEHRNVFEYVLNRCASMAKARLKELL